MPVGPPTNRVTHNTAQTTFLGVWAAGKFVSSLLSLFYELTNWFYLFLG